MISDNFINILYEDNHLLIVDKPAGVPVQKDSSNDECLTDALKEYIKTTYDKPGNVYLGLVHRLDRPVSGIIVLAKTSKALERMNKLFKERNITKTYYALVENEPGIDSGTINLYLKKDKSRNKVNASHKQRSGSVLAITDFELKGMVAGKYLLKINPKTGRPHQIRASLAYEIGPIVGDVKYGSKYKSKNAEGLSLHSYSLEFIHPVKKENILIKSSLPKKHPHWKDFADYLLD